MKVVMNIAGHNMGNSKSEALNTKQIQIIKTQNPKQFRTFVFRILDLFRISNLEFRIFV